VRLGNWKLVSQYDYSKKQFMKWELYNMKSDRSELDDLFEKESAIAGHLISLYEKHAARIGVVSKETLDKK
jgi:arylsulfatase